MATIQELQIQESNLTQALADAEAQYNAAAQNWANYSGWFTACDSYSLAQRLVKGCHKRVVPPGETHANLEAKMTQYRNQMNAHKDTMQSLAAQIVQVNEQLTQEQEQIQNANELEVQLAENQTVIDKHTSTQAGLIFKTYVLPLIGAIVLGLAIWLLVKAFKKPKTA